MYNTRCEICKGKGKISDIICSFIGCEECLRDRDNKCKFYVCSFDKSGQTTEQTLEYKTYKCCGCNGTGLAKIITRFELMDL